MRERLSGDIIIEHEPKGLRGCPCVVIQIEGLGNLRLRFTLEDAENIGEKLIECVRRAEETAEK